MNSNTVDQYIASKLVSKRKDLGLSQRALAAQVEITYQQLQKYENATNRIGASMLYKFANALEVDISFFFEGYESDTDPDQLLLKLSIDYPKLDPSTLSELIEAFSKIPPITRKNLLTFLKDISNDNVDFDDINVRFPEH